MVFCMACNCSNDSRKTTNIRYHRLPRDKKLKKVWLAKISRENVKDTKDTVLCSEHFETHCFERDLRAELTGYKSKSKLKPDAIPTIFSHRSPPSKRRRVTSEKRQLEKAKKEVRTPERQQTISTQHNLRLDRYAFTLPIVFDSLNLYIYLILVLVCINRPPSTEDRNNFKFNR